MAQTIFTPGGDALQVSQPPTETDNPFEDLIPAGVPLADDIGLGEISLEMTDKEKAITNPFLDIPKANLKNPLETAQEAYRIGQESVGIDFDFYSLQRRNLLTGQAPTQAELDELDERERRLSVEAYRNQADNIATGTAYKAVEILPPMISGTEEGLRTGIQYGTTMGLAAGAATLPLGPEVAAPTTAAFGKVGFVAGSLKGSYDYWNKQGTGASYRELLRNNVDPNFAAQVAQVVGPAYAAIEYAQVNKIISVAGGRQVKSALLRGAMKGVAKFLPKVAKATEKTVTAFGKTAAGKATEFVLAESAEEGLQEAITATGTAIGKAQAEAVKEGATTEALEVLGRLDLGDAGEVLGRGLTAFRESIGPLAVLGGSAKLTGATVREAGKVVENIAAARELNELSDLRAKLQAAGAPKTADALTSIEGTAPTLKAEDTVGLEEDLEAAGVQITTATPVPTPVAETPKPFAGLPGDELGAKIFSSIRARKPIAKADIDKVGGFMLSSDWKLNEETGNYEYQGPTNETKETPQIPIAEAEAPAAKKPEAKAAKAEAIAPVEAVKPKPAEKGVAPVVPALEEKPMPRSEVLAKNWLSEVDRAKNNRERQDLISIFRGKIDSLSEDERQAAKIFDSELIKRAEKQAVEAKAPMVETEEPKMEVPKVEAPKVEAVPPLLKWEDVLKNQKQIRFLRKVFKDANARLPKEQQISPKTGWKGQDFFRALETIYGQLAQLEFAKPELEAPKPGAVAPQVVDKAAQQRQRRLAGLVKVFSNPNLNGDQIFFRDTALDMVRRISKQAAAKFPNLVSADTEIYTRLVERIAGRLLSSVNLGRPILFNEKGQPTDLTEENISKFLTFSAKRAGQDAINVQSARREVAAQFGTAPAEGAVTQPEAAREEAKPAGLQIPAREEAPVAEPRAVAALREAAKLIRDQSGPEVKLVIDWIVDTMIGADTELGKLKSYKELAEYLSKVANRKVSDKRVGEFVNKAVEQIAQNLNEENIEVRAEDLMMLMTPEGRAARERKAAEEAERKQAREVRQAIANLSDRARNLNIGFGAKQSLVDAIGTANTLTRARITSEIIVPIEEGLIGENEVAQRLDNIQKGIENAKPRVRQAVPRRGRGAAQQAEEGPVRGRTGEGVEGERGRPGAGEAAEGQPETAAGGVAPVGARPGGTGREVGGKQPEAPSPISIDPKLTSKNASAVVKALVSTITSSGLPANYVVDDTIGKPMSVMTSDVESGSEDPVIYVNPKLLGRFARALGPKKKFDEWAYLAINEEVVHYKYLKLLKSEAEELNIPYKQHLKNETKRVASIIKKRRGLKKKIELLYNEGRPFSGEMGNFQMVFEYMRMITQQHMTGKFTELTWIHLTPDLETIMRSLEAQERRFIFRFIDAIRQFLYGVTGRTAAETKFLRQTADTVAQMAQRVTRDLAKPNEIKPVSMNYFPTKQDSLAKIEPKKGELQKAREELRKDTGLSRASLQFLKDYAKDLKIHVPTTKMKVIVTDEKTGKKEEVYMDLPFWKKPDYVQAIKAKLDELKGKGGLGVAMPMRFKTEYAFTQLDKNFGKKTGFLRGLSVDSANTLPWENLKAKILKGTSPAEAKWVLPTLEALVKNGRVDVDQAKQALQVLATQKITSRKLVEPKLAIGQEISKEQKAFIELEKQSSSIRHRMETDNDELAVFRSPSLAREYAKNKISSQGLKIISDKDKQLAENLLNDGTYGGVYRATDKNTREDFENLLTEEGVYRGAVTQEMVEKKLPALEKLMLDAYSKYADRMMLQPSKEFSNLRIFEIFEQVYMFANSQNDLASRKKVLGMLGRQIVETTPPEYKSAEERASARYRPINPKPFEKMQDVREILVKTPIGEVAGSSHFKDKDVVGFGRMYTTSIGNKQATFLFEVQTDASTSLLEQLSSEASPFSAAEFEPKFTVENENDLREALESFLQNGGSISPNQDGDLIFTPQNKAYSSKITSYEGDKSYRLLDGWGVKLYDELLKRPELAKKIKPVEADTKTKEVVSWANSLNEAAPLVKAYESLVLKHAIADAVSKNHDFIVITDAETAAMTEGHSEVNDGMWAHYGSRNGSLHNLARKLTGDVGTEFNDGPSILAFEYEVAERWGEPPEMLERYGKGEVTGVAYNLDKVKALGEDSEIYNILGVANVPTDRPYWLKPDGELVDIEETALVDLMSVGSHAEAAVEWLRENEPKADFLTEWGLLDPLDRKERQQMPVMEMLKRGWLRVVGDGFNLFFEGNPNKTQMERLFEAAINDEVKLIQDLSGLSGRARSKTIYEPPMSDELGVAMPRRGFSSTEFKTFRDWAPLPDSIEGFTFIRDLRGTFDVRLYRDELGNKYVVKRGQSQEQFENEIAAENIYRLLNYPVPQSKLITTPEGQTAKISDYIEGQTLGQFEKEIKDVEPGVVEEVYKQIGDGLLIDAFLFNYDVLGQDLDNIVVTTEEASDEDVISLGKPDKMHTAYRIDNGGTFDIRARGLRKNNFFYDSLADLKRIYPRLKLDSVDMVAQLSDIVLNADAILNSVPERLRPMMAQRLQWMADQFSAVETMPPTIGRNDKEISSHFERLSREMEAVKITRNSKGELINERTGLPSQIKIVTTPPKGTYFPPSTKPIVRIVPKSEFRYRLERTPSFKMWFGDWENFPEGKGTSEVLDDSGEPLIMYHGTSRKNRNLSYPFLRKGELASSLDPMYPMRAYTTANGFRGMWLSSSRDFAEQYANLNTFEAYDENIVIPVYVKATNPFDPRNPEHVQKLIAYAKAKGSAFTFNQRSQVSIENGFFDWTRFEGSTPGGVVPPPSLSLPEAEREREFFKLFIYNTLEAIINLGFDGVWVREKLIEASSNVDVEPKNRVDEIIAARQINEKNIEEESLKLLKEDVEAYNENSVWNLLVWRPDAIKSSVNSGKFKSKAELENFKLFAEASERAQRVRKNNRTLWNEYKKDGITYVSYDSPEDLATYAHMTTNQLSRANIANEQIKEGLVFLGRRTAPGVKTARGRETADILGVGMPRRFGVRLKDKVSEEAYAKLKNLNYEPIPDAMTEAEADEYLAKNGLRGSMDAALSDASPLQHGSRELLAQKIILGMNELYAKDKDPRILDDLLMFIDRFLEQSSGIGRALRALSFWSNLTPEGMLMLYKKKSDEVNREIRDKFNTFFIKVKEELSSLPEGAVDEALKRMSGLLKKAQTAADESKKKLAENNTMTFWEQFANQMGESIANKAAQQLAEAEAAAAQAAGIPVDQMSPDLRAAVRRMENAKSINQAAQEMSREIKKMFMTLAEEQGRRIRDPRINTDEEFANKTIEEQEKLRKEDREANQRKNFTEMLSRWPKALQAWKTTTDSIRARTANNPELAEMFSSFLGLVLESPFTMPQLKRFISLRGVKLEDLIRKHYEEGKLANNAYSLARELVEEAGLGVWEEEIGSDEKGAEGFFKFKRTEDMKKEEPAIREPMGSLSERLTNAIALQIQEIVVKETEKKLNRLIKSYADKKLEPSLYRFAKRFVEYQALGLFSNNAAWTEFQRQEGLDKLKPEVVEKLANIMGEAQKLVGYRKDEKIADALSLIAYKTQLNKYNIAKSWWYVSILSGFGTQFANLLGNFTNTVLMAIPTIGKYLYRAAKNPSANKAMLGSMYRALSLSAMDVGNVLMTGRIGTRKAEPKFFGKAATDLFEYVVRNATGTTKKEQLIRIGALAAASIRRVMTATDMVFYNWNKEMFMFEAAYQKAEQAGLKGKEASAKALEYTFRNSEKLAAAKAQAESEGYVIDSESKTTRFLQKAEQAIRIQEIVDDNTQLDSPEIGVVGQITGTETTFNEEPRGVLGAFHRMIGSFAKEHPLKSAVFVPFTRIVANVWNQSIDFTGWGVMRARGLPKVLGKNLAGKFAMEYKGTAEEQKVQRDLAYARGATGLGAVFVLGLLDQILCGNYERYGVELCINGQGPKETAQKELLKNRLGWKPNSMFFRANLPGFEDGYYMSYMFSPLAMGLSALGLWNDNETYDYFNEKEPSDVALAFAHRVATIMFDMNFLSGASDLFEMLNPSEPERALAKAKSFLSRVGSAVIVPNFFRDLDQLLVSPMLGYKGRTAREGPLQGALVANTPIARHFYGQQELDMLGKPAEMQFRPMSFAQKDALIEVLLRKNALPTAPKKDKLFGVIKMTDEQYADFREERAKQLGQSLGQAGIIETIDAMSPEMAQLYVGRLAQRANALAKAKLIREAPELLEEVREEKTKGLR